MSEYLMTNGSRVRVTNDVYNGRTSRYAGRKGVITSYHSTKRAYKILIEGTSRAVVVSRSRVEAIGDAHLLPAVVRPNPLLGTEERNAWRQAQQFEGIKPLAYQLYDGAELRSFTRPGAMDHEQHPSRIGSVRVWRDGREEVVA